MSEFKQSPGGIWFKPKEHIYLNDDGERYVSGTAFVGLFKPKFKADFWSKLKVYEKYFENIDLTPVQRKEFNGWYERIKRRPPYKVNLWEYVKKYYQVFNDNKEIEKDTLELAKKLAKENNIILDLESGTISMKQDWSKKAKTATDKGSKFHDARELAIKTRYGHPDDWSGYNIKYPFLRRNPYAELRLYNHKYKLAGSADYIKITSKKGKFDMIDYKTSKEISTYVYTNPWTGKSDNMLSPIEKMGNCNFNHYTLQLSLYAWMMEELGYTPNKLQIEHALVDEHGKIIKDSKGRTRTEFISVHYAKKAILKMLDYYEEHYKNNSIYSN